jgi:hypothetical protein
MPKIDLKKELKVLYSPPAKEVVAVAVPPANFVMIDGMGDPNTSTEFQGAIDALYSVSYTMKFMAKKSEEGGDYVVMPLEGLWWTNGLGFDMARKEQWQWTAMIMQPDFIRRDLFERAREEAAKKKSTPAFGKMRFERFLEGKAAQTIHIGPFSAEGPTVKKIHGFIESNGHKLNGKHHEIYLSDFRKTSPEKLKTIIRQPYR